MTTIDSLKAKGKILIIGDSLIDETWFVDVKKISPEAPIPVASLTNRRPVRTHGGASLAAYYAMKKNIDSIFLTCTTYENAMRLRVKKIDILNYHKEKGNDIKKIRYIDKNTGYHILRVDNDDIVDRRDIYPELMENTLNQTLKEDKIKVMVLLDYNKEVLTNKETCKKIIKIGKENSIPVYVDSRGDVQNFIGCDILKVNDNEYAAACAALNTKNPNHLAQLLKLKWLIVTHAKEGATVYDTGSLSCTVKPEVFIHKGSPDPTGCGDVFDINFCYYHYKKRLDVSESLNLAVDNATAYAYEPIGERLC